MNDPVRIEGTLTVTTKPSLKETLHEDVHEELSRLRAAIALLATCVGANIISRDNARRLEDLLTLPHQRKPEP